MSAAAGQTLRRLGLLIEAASLFGVLAARRGVGVVRVWEGLRVDPNVALPVLFGLGALLWLAGTLTIRKARRG